MPKIVLLPLIITTLLFATSQDKNNTKKSRLDKQVQKEIEKEKRYAEEQRFYDANEYDFKGAEVNPKSLEKLPDIVEDDFDMDSVYD
ncbi:MAG: hypothetical protein K0U47_05280 [Epsilonproteobacteria bacterium]|nr:hypothetical protein [Campylobacterota bacterium]